METTYTLVMHTGEYSDMRYEVIASGKNPDVLIAAAKQHFYNSVVCTIREFISFDRQTRKWVNDGFYYDDETYDELNHISEEVYDDDGLPAYYVEYLYNNDPNPNWTPEYRLYRLHKTPVLDKE